MNGPGLTEPCVVCGKTTFMGKYRNKPERARERYDGKKYLRYCGPEHEETFFKLPTFGQV